MEFRQNFHLVTFSSLSSYIYAGTIHYYDYTIVTITLHAMLRGAYRSVILPMICKHIMVKTRHETFSIVREHYICVLHFKQCFLQLFLKSIDICTQRTITSRTPNRTVLNRLVSLKNCFIYLYPAVKFLVHDYKFFVMVSNQLQRKQEY